MYIVGHVSDVNTGITDIIAGQVSVSQAHTPTHSRVLINEERPTRVSSALIIRLVCLRRGNDPKKEREKERESIRGNFLLAFSY